MFIVCLWYCPRMNLDLATDTELLEAWRAGNGRAGDRLFQRHFGSLRKFFLNKVPADDLDDLIQNTFMGCVKSVSEFRGESTFRTYLFQIARKRLIDYYRKKHRRADALDLDIISVADMDPSPSSIVARRQQEQLLLQALRRIPINYQIVLELYYWEKLSATELGQVLGLGESAVRGRIRLAREQLRKALESLARTPQELTSTIENLEQWAEGIREQIHDGST